MAKKLIDQEEAARMLGVSIDELNSMRDRKMIYPKRDAGEWKFTQEEIDRVLAEQAAGKSDAWGDKLSLDDMSLELDPDAIDLSGAEGPPAESSTVIGKSKESGGPPPMPAAGASDVQLVTEMGAGSDVRLVSESGLKSGSSKKTGSSSGLLDDIGRDPSGSDMPSSGSLRLADDELKLAESGVKKSGSDTRKGASDLHIASDEELVLDPAAGSDITIGGGDSGISLVDPADSGLSLEQPLELEGSAVESLDLGEEDIVSLEDVGGDDETQLKSEDDFLLTPLEEPADEADSGSQVIALDSEEEFGTGLTPAPGMLEEDLGAGAALVSGGIGTSPALAGAVMASAGYVIDPPYSAWNVVFLVCCFFFLFVGGMFTYDLMRHMWSWDQPYALNSSMMDSLVNLLP